MTQSGETPNTDHDNRLQKAAIELEKLDHIFTNYNDTLRPANRIFDILTKINREINKKSQEGFDQYWINRLKQSLIEFKVSASGMANIPIGARQIYALGVGILAIFSPEDSKEVRSYRPRRAFATIVKNLLDNPLAFATMTLEEKAEFRTMAIDNSYFSIEERLSDGRIDSSAPGWSAIVKAGMLIENPLLRVHRSIAQWIGETCPLIGQEESDQDFCNRLIGEIKHFYNVQSPYHVVFEKDDTGVASASYFYDHNTKRHVATFTNFHQLDEVQKFRVVMHECAAHAVRAELDHNASYSLPEFMNTDEQRGSNVVIEEKTVSNSSPITTNYTLAVKAFGEKNGSKMYLAERDEREALFVETMAVLGIAIRICRERGLSVRNSLTSSYEGEAYEIVEPDLYPEKIRPIPNLQNLLKAIKRPKQC